MRIALTMILCLLGIFCLISYGCHTTNIQTVDKGLSKSEALSLAVFLANSECDNRFSSTPFDTNSYTIEYRDGFWHWGAFDILGIYGYSAIVSFDNQGDARSVEVFYSTIAPWIIIRQEDLRKDK